MVNVKGRGKIAEALRAVRLDGDLLDLDQPTYERTSKNAPSRTCLENSWPSLARVFLVALRRHRPKAVATITRSMAAGASADAAGS